MRTTIAIPDDSFRKTKATAALRGSTMKDLIVEALQREVDPNDHAPKRHRAKLPVMM